MLPFTSLSFRSPKHLNETEIASSQRNYQITQNADLNCCACDYKCENSNDLLRHIFAHKDASNLDLFKCTSCGHLMKHLGDFKAHVEIHGDVTEKVECCLCEFECKSKNDLVKHLSTHRSSSDLNLFKCEHCGNETKQLINLRFHILKHKEVEDIKCSSVFKVYPNLETAALISSKRREQTHKGNSRRNKYECTQCGTKHITNADYCSHINSEEKKYKCKECPFQTAAPLRLKRHMQTHMDHSRRKLFACEQCDHQYTTRDGLKRHELTHKNSSDTPTFQCDACSFKTIYKTSMDRHKSRYNYSPHFDPSAKLNVDKYKCDECPFETTALSRWHRHKQTHMDDSKRKQCDECPFGTFTLSALKYHKLTHMDRSERKSFQCAHCGKKYSRKNTLTMHMLLHKDEEVLKFHCDVCTYETMYKSNLRKHMSKHKQQVSVDASKLSKEDSERERYSTNTKERKSSHVDRSNDTETETYRCKKCPYKTTAIHRLNRHNESHMDRSERKLHSCDQCGAQYTTKASLKKHILLHKTPSEMPMLQCEICGYKTIYKSTLRKHMEKHADRSQLKVDTKTKYKCDECPFQTAALGRLKRHNATHVDRSERRLFQCEQCSFKFTAKSTLKQHILLHKDPSEVPMFRCDLCGYKTLYKSIFKLHNLKHTNSAKFKTRRKCQAEEKKYKCDECSQYETDNISLLGRHKSKHRKLSKQDLFGCHLCGSKYTAKEDLEKHIFKHGDSFKASTNNFDHEDCSSGSDSDKNSMETLDCCLCKYKCRSKNDLIRHISIHKDSFYWGLLKCEFCDYTTKYLCDLKLHLLIHGKQSGNL